MAKRNRERCEWCTKRVAVTELGDMYRHNDWSGKKCSGSDSTIVARTVYRHVNNYDRDKPIYCASCGRYAGSCNGC